MVWNNRGHEYWRMKCGWEASLLQVQCLQTYPLECDSFIE